MLGLVLKGDTEGTTCVFNLYISIPSIGFRVGRAGVNVAVVAETADLHVADRRIYPQPLILHFYGRLRTVPFASRTSTWWVVFTLIRRISPAIVC